MRLLAPVRRNPSAPLGRANPIAKLAAALLLMVVLFVSLDGVTAGIIFLGLVGTVFASGLSVPALLARAWPLALAGLSLGIFNALFAADQVGPTVVSLGPVRIGADTLVNGMGLAVRLLAIALAGLLATATSEPIDVADALVQQLGVSPRFAIGVMAALRLLPLFAREWLVVGMARRARGIEAGRSPVGALSLFAGRLLSLLVGAVRRGSRMALAMEARGFGAMACRTVARPHRMRASDWVLIGGALLLGAVAVATSVAIGTWRPLLG